jgi:hypothetical protein
MLGIPGTLVAGGIVMTRDRTLARRTARGAVIAVALALMVAAPAAAAQPTRTVHSPGLARSS